MPTHYTRLLQFSQQFGKFYVREFTPLLKETGLSMREIHVLLFLANNPQFDTARDITEFRSISKSQVSQAVDYLAAEGILSRTPDPFDRRVVHLSITEYGQTYAERCQEIQIACGHRLLSGLSAEDKTQLYHLLDMVLTNSEHLFTELGL